MEDMRTPAYHEALEEFVILWGDMASAWGINRTMAQIHALLYAESEPQDTDSIMRALNISRGNANMNLHKLMEWELIHKVQFKGDRRDYYRAETDVWEIVSTIIRERQQREISPIRQNLERCIAILKHDTESEESNEFKKRIENYIEFLEMFERFTSAMLPYISKKNLKYLKQLVKLVEVRESLKSASGDEQ